MLKYTQILLHVHMHINFTCVVQTLSVIRIFLVYENVFKVSLLMIIECVCVCVCVGVWSWHGSEKVKLVNTMCDKFIMQGLQDTEKQ